MWCLGVSLASSPTTLVLVCAALSILALEKEVCFFLSQEYCILCSSLEHHLFVCPCGVLFSDVLKCHHLPGAIPVLPDDSEIDMSITFCPFH